MQYTNVGQPIHMLVIDHRPSSGSRLGKAAYTRAIQEVAQREIVEPLKGNDLEVEVLYLSRAGIIIDLDNVIRPTLNALTGFAYRDDRQVRSIRAARFDSTKVMRLEGSARVSEALFRGGTDHRVVVLIYSEAERRSKRIRGRTAPRPEGTIE